MATVDELQFELVKQSSARLEAEHERTRLEEQLRKLIKENHALREENAAATQQVEEMQNEMADLSSSLVEEANVKVGEANRKVASAQRMVAERDTLLEIQASELQEIKHMMARQESAAPAQRVPRRIRRPSFEGKLDANTILDLDSYASPVRPLLRVDTREFREFCEIFPVEGAARSFHFSLEALEAPAWRRSRFVTKLIQEDIEPALRLDRAAHMNWLTCRAFLSAVLDQTLILEPVSAKERPWAHRPSHPCLLCGENRAELIYSRYFWARTTPEAEPLVLDLACLARVRLACELIGFVRGITDSKPGHTREQQEQAWRECTSLREQLFWARSGGLYPEPGEGAELGDADADTSDLNSKDPSDRLRRMPGSGLSGVSTPQMAQGGFAVASPANTISSAVLENAVPPRPADQKHPSVHAPKTRDRPQNLHTGSDHLDADDAARKESRESGSALDTDARHVSPSAAAASETTAREYTHTHDIAFRGTAFSARADSTSSSDAQLNNADPASPTQALEATGSLDPTSPASPPIPHRSRSPPQFATTSQNTRVNNEHGTSSPSKSDIMSASPTKSTKARMSQRARHEATQSSDESGVSGEAAEDAGATPEPEAEFHFADEEFHSPQGTPAPAPAPASREKMPGGWPG